MPDPQHSFGDFVLERLQHRVRHRDGTHLNLTPRVFSALVLFAAKPGQLLSKDALMLALWPGRVVEENNLSQVVSTLRRALGDDTQGSRYIQSVPRQGFRFVAEVTVLPDQEEVVAAVPPGATPAPLPPDATTLEPTAAPFAAPPMQPIPPSLPLRRRWC